MYIFEVHMLIPGPEKDNPRYETVNVLCNWFTVDINGEYSAYSFYLDPDDDSDPILISVFPFTNVLYVRLARRQSPTDG